MLYTHKTGLALATLVMLGLAAARPATAGSFAAQNYTGDADSGVASTKTYTHKVDLNGAGETINGVAFAPGSAATGYSLTGAGNAYSGNTAGNNNLPAGSGTRTLVSDFFYQPNSTEQLTLTGLAPNTTYKTTFYNVGFGNSRLIDIMDGQGTAVTYNEDGAGAGNGSLLTDTFTTGAGVSSYTYSFTQHAGNTGDAFHQYGFSNEVVPAAGPTAPRELVSNGGFELGTSTITGPPGTPNSWSYLDSGGNLTTSALQTSYGGDIGNQYSGGQVTKAQSNFAAFINNNNGGAQTGGTAGFGAGFQYLGTLTAGTTYTLTGLVGNRLDNATSANGSIGLFTFSGVNGTPTTTLVAPGSNVTASPAKGTFGLISYTFTATAAQAGTPFGVEFAMAGPFGASQIDFDNISVLAVAAPEPSQVAAFGLGVLGLAGMALKARKRRSA